jgi:membrane protein
MGGVPLCVPGPIAPRNLITPIAGGRAVLSTNRAAGQAECACPPALPIPLELRGISPVLNRWNLGSAAEPAIGSGEMGRIMAGKPDRVARGVEADSPMEYGRRAWMEILKRVWTSSNRHNIGFLAAGVTFFGFLSLAPGLGLIVMTYGFLADPATIYANMIEIIRLVPPQAAVLINDQLANLIQTASATRGLAMIPAVAVALYGASGAARGIISSLNIIYDQEEKRGFITLVAISVAIAAAAVLIAVLGLLTASVTAFLQALLAEFGPVATMSLRVLAWLVAAGFATLTLTLIYRFGPCRAPAKLRWLSVGSVTATVLWLIGSVLFGWYVSVANYDTTYGPLGTVVALIMWMYVSAYALLLGAFLDAEAERQTARDTTTGRPHPLGKRGAVVADTSAALEDAPA